MRSTPRLFVLALLVLVAFSGGRAGAASPDLTAASPGAAVFEGQVIDLREGWGEARACLVWDRDAIVECFRSELELLNRISEMQTRADPSNFEGTVASSSCSSSLRLYSGIGYTGQALYVSQRSTWINLSNYGFSNLTSSYKVGACSSYFADYANGGGDWYPTSYTQAWDQGSSMISGWDNRVSSIYLT